MAATIASPGYADLEKKNGDWLAHAGELGYMTVEGYWKQGMFFYYPITRIVYSTTYYAGPSAGREESIQDDHLYDAVVSSRKMIQPITCGWGTELVRAIVQLEISFINNVDLLHFTKIGCDERCQLEKFRDHIKEQLIDIMANEGSESFDRELQRIGVNLRNGVRSLTSDIQLLRKKAALQSIGATIGTVIATLLAINGAMFEASSTTLGAGGGVAVVLKIIENYGEKHQAITDSPYYYLSLLHKA